MVYTYKSGKEIYKKDRHLQELEGMPEAYVGHKFSKNYLSHKHKKRDSDGGKNKH